MHQVFGYCLECAFYSRQHNSSGTCCRNGVINPQNIKYKAFGIKVVKRVISRGLTNDLVLYCKDHKGRIIVPHEPSGQM